MGLFKRCDCKKKDRCEHPWWGSFRANLDWHNKVSLSKWANRDIRSKADAQAILDEMKVAIRQGTFDPKGQKVAAPVDLLTFRRFADLFDQRHVAMAKPGGLKSADTVSPNVEMRPPRNVSKAAKRVGGVSIL